MKHNYYTYLKQQIIAHNILFFRVLLSLVFLGHGLVSLGYSSSIRLHTGILEGVNYTHYSTEQLLTYFGVFDLVMALLILLTFNRWILFTALTYLIFVSIAAFRFYQLKTAQTFGLSETMRRMPWMFFCLFLIFNKIKNKTYFQLIRIGLALAFLSHGLASLGIWGLNAGHVELAKIVLKNTEVSAFILTSGCIDTTVGICLLIGLFNKWLSYFAIVWIAVVVTISFIASFPDGLFRLGFWLGAFYFLIDERCHYNILNKFKHN
ncbi:MAG: DoxX family membrane protein [Bacteroidia bacterium]|nr:DoxX family membrane protein [Bacteroidia bacterium]